MNAIIGRRDTLVNLIERLGPPYPTELSFDLVIVPLDENRLDAISMSSEPSFEGFAYLMPKMADQIGFLINKGRALYIETNYFGGIGGQAAALFEDGALIRRDFDSTIWRHFDSTCRGQAVSSISQGLEHLGVVPHGGKDAFDSLGLARYRTMTELGLVEPD